MNNRIIKIAIVAGEKSGDILASNLISELKTLFDSYNQSNSETQYQLEFEGVAGPLMMEHQVTKLFDMEELAVMGLVEVLGRLRRLLKIRKQLTQHWIKNPPDIFIGVDAPDFNLTLEKNLKQAGIKTVHYVGPSIWAWRQKRVFKVKAAVDLVLALLPFEKPFYDKYQVPCQFVGHTLADQIPLESAQASARAQLNLTQNRNESAESAKIIAVLPGSRSSEVELLAPEFAKACEILYQQDKRLIFVAASVNDKRKVQIQQAFNQYAPSVDLIIIDNQSREVMAASDAIMIASGTATLEAALIKRPMVACYKFKALSYWIFKQMVKVKYFSLPNIIADKAVIPELLQDQVTGEAIATQIQKFLSIEQAQLNTEFLNIHHILRQDAGKQAALAVSKLIHAN
ncbi:lipid-A-disaccharide synthase [Catenovulum maritimum]|uniref:Lipid-A-disaccharide synthase n=1 Tax=Catenovulum maritimum TaxID=1513271 RepID=A0A0J8GS50_9ALTE|nr:lipid-A-disaccharide synthase [Catenovulum maritimum]KMT65547.1 lipid-A-disaccharide synthase [Catenovulum maritimum]